MHRVWGIGFRVRVSGLGLHPLEDTVLHSEILVDPLKRNVFRSKTFLENPRSGQPTKTWKPSEPQNWDHICPMPLWSLLGHVNPELGWPLGLKTL